MQRDRIVAAPKAWGAIECVIARAHLKFRCLDLKNVPEDQRASAALLQAQHASPFRHAGVSVALVGEAAYVWMWDATQITDQLLAGGIAPSTIARYLPEPLLLPPPASADQAQSVRLMRCADGFEAQAWQSGVLMASRWWLETPDDQQWRQFLRDASVSSSGPGTAHLPAPVSLNRLEKPWAAPLRQQSAHQSTLMTRAALAGGAVLAIMSGYQSVTWWRLDQAITSQREKLTELEQKAQPVQQARAEAFVALEQINYLAGLDSFPQQALLLAEVGRKIPGNGPVLKEWDYKPGKLKLTIAQSAQTSLSAAAMITALTETGWFREVRADGASNATQLVLEMEVVTRLAYKAPKPADSTDTKAAEKPTPAKT